jgi:peptidoglycan/xylan/chitin deacetylase (PgdA/CDA1 family)
MRTNNPILIGLITVGLAIFYFTTLSMKPEIETDAGRIRSVKPIGAPKTKKLASPAEILQRQTVPVLCYHQIRDWRPGDSKRAKDYIVPPVSFNAQLKMLADSGYQTILPQQLINHLKFGDPLPRKPVMLTFDDTDLSQYEIAAREMKKYGFRGVFFVMTVAIGRPGYMNASQIRELDSLGHVVGCHTWDHHNVKKYEAEDWTTQLDKPLATLKKITGRQCEFFAYPFGLWDTSAFPHLYKRNITAAFQLSAPSDSVNPLYSLKRMIVPGQWSLKDFDKRVVR